MKRRESENGGGGLIPFALGFFIAASLFFGGGYLLGQYRSGVDFGLVWEQTRSEATAVLESVTMKKREKLNSQDTGRNSEDSEVSVESADLSDTNVQETVEATGSSAGEILEDSEANVEETNGAAERSAEEVPETSEMNAGEAAEATGTSAEETLGTSETSVEEVVETAETTAEEIPETNAEETIETSAETTVEVAQEGDEVTTAATEETVEEESFTITPMTGTKYAKSSVNVRRKPNKNGEKIGMLSMNQEVSLLGQCVETGWYMISFQGEEAYVSNQYLVDEMVVIAKTEEVVVTRQEEVAVDPNTIPVPIKSLANYKSLKKSCTDAEFQQAYNIALEIVKPLVGLSREEQIYGIGEALSHYYIEYSDTLPHYNDPYGYFVNNCASCAGCTRAVGLCLNILGIPYEHVNENQWCHQWARANVDGTYWECDAQIGLYAPEDGSEGYLFWY